MEHTLIAIPKEAYQEIQLMKSDIAEIKHLILRENNVLQKEYLSIKETCSILNFGRTKIHKLINETRLDRVKRDRRAYITRESIERFLKTPTNK
ncbi:helix-turn-helix domain-containing protein [Reichenbachiella carrageenanivorans]|uniref:Helix-turn-helix domain-containing protein n=1 Tax=Reichenbachiella carrageenanivorans TaxID=2979869 RepID=A0ABY6CVS9_9BACT|nr:helix-turn-helix domain-containing protein [Reichenbachiella carrageenanivorans]UXX78012.1 helix-turn-helix domain-containing protein [Reichenbachiella carrageenanivorans]